jgi:hypothetical protein
MNIGLRLGEKRCARLVGLLLAWLLGDFSAAAQQQPVASAAAAPDTAVEADQGADLQMLTRRAGLIFAGTVIRVDLPQATGSAGDGAVAITFRVNDGIRGTATGEELTIREWRGLWQRRHDPRYRVGDKVLVFYHQRSSSGLSSPVAGDAGRFAVGSGDRVALSTQQQHALLRSSRLHTDLTDEQIAKGRLSYEQLAKIVRQLAAQF